MANASLSFLPWVRQGAAAAIANADTLDATPAAVASVSPQMTPGPRAREPLKGLT